MKKLILIPCSCWLFACTNNVKPTDTDPAILSQDHEFFPVNAFLKGEVNEVDSFKFPVRKYNTVNSQTDSVLISPEEFHLLASEFTKYDINNPSIKKFYKETSFADQSIPNVTFNYSTRNKDLPLQRMDIIVNPDPVLSDQVKSVYIEIINTSGDTSVIKKLYWKTNKYFQIISSKQAIGSPALYSQVKVSWSFAD